MDIKSRSELFLEPVKELLGQLAENAKKAPGWLPLLLACFFAAYFVPEQTLVVGRLLKAHKEITVSAITLLLYITGDALDKPVFKCLRPRWLRLHLRRAKRALQIKSGTYRVSMSLAVAAKRYDRSWIRVKNESAKFLRSLVVPGFVATIVLACLQRIDWFAIVLSFTLISLASYVWLKAKHIADLYDLAEPFSSDSRYEAHTLNQTSARLFFWDGELIASAGNLALDRKGAASDTNMSFSKTFDDVGTGSPIVFLHGFPFNRSTWREQIDSFSGRGYRCIAPDLRGLGENKSDDEIVTMENMALDVAALMAELKIDSAIICGLSMGCYVAFEFAHLFPARCRALILCGPKAQGPDETEKKSREGQARAVLAEGMGFALRSIATKLLAHRTEEEKPHVVRRVTEMLLRTDPHGAAAAQRGMAERRDYSDDLAKIGVPTLIVAGREDAVRTPEDAEFIHHGISGSQLVVIDDAGHLMNMEQPERFNEVLTTFLSSVSEARP